MAKLWYKFWAKLFFLFFVFCIGILFGSSSPARLVAGKDGGLEIIKTPSTDEQDKRQKPKKSKSIK